MIFDKLYNWYFSKQALPYWGILMLDTVITAFAWYFSGYMQNGGLEFAQHFWLITKYALVCTIIFVAWFRVFHTYSGVIRYSSYHDLLQILCATSCATLTVFIGLGCISAAGIELEIAPRKGYILTAFVISTLGMWLVRTLVKAIYEAMLQKESTQKAFVYGVKEGAISLAKSIQNFGGESYTLVGFVSPDGELVSKYLMGVHVFREGPTLIHHMKDKGAKVLIVSPLQVDNFREKTDLIDQLTDAGIKILMIPMAEEWDGKSELKYSQLREVEIEDLLPRNQIKVDMDAIGALLKGKKILITGAAGSIGSEMVRQVAVYNPAEMILVDQAETPMHDVRLWCQGVASPQPSPKGEGERKPTKFFTIVASITNEDFMEKIFREHRPDYVFHAAAYKHVPMMEDNPAMAVQNNIYGTRIIADLAVKYGTKKFVMISTDKAVNPTNVMGCSKRICEIYCQSLNGASPQPSPKGEGEKASPKSSPKGKEVEPTSNSSLKGRGKSSLDLGIHTADPAWYGILKGFAEENRKNPTEAESLLWNAIKNNAIGFKFRQQHIIQDFIVDFYCNEKNLTIELDGGYHNAPTQMISDEQRTARLESLGYTELRFTNDEVIGNIDAVLSKIKEVASSLPSEKSLPLGGDLEEASAPSPLGEGRDEAPCQFITTRFGNVLGSNGSVIPIFKEQIKKGGPITVTHPDIIRYFMLIPEACKLVLEAGTMGNGGEIYVFDMGKPVKIVDLAKRMIKLSGAKDIEIEFTGLRDGEKLYEEVLSDEENTLPTTHPKIKVAKVREYDYAEACRNEEELLEISKTFDDMAIVKKMKEIVPEYKSKVSKYEVLDK